MPPAETKGNTEQQAPPGYAHGRVPRAVRERQIIELAERLFAERGYHAASMDELARRAGVSKPVIYEYFGSKERLYRVCVDRAVQRFSEDLKRAVRSEREPARRMWAGALAFFGFLERHREEWSVLFEEAPGRGGEFAAEVSRIRRDLAGLIARLMTETVEAQGGNEELDEEGIETIAHALAGAFEAAAAWWREHPDVPQETVALRVVNFAVLGLQGLLTGRRWLPG